MYIAAIPRNRPRMCYIAEQLQNRINRWVNENTKLINVKTYFEFYGLVDNFLNEKIRNNELDDFKIICYVCYDHAQGIAYYKSDDGHYKSIPCNKKIPPRIFEIHVRNTTLTVEF